MQSIAPEEKRLAELAEEAEQEALAYEGSKADDLNRYLQAEADRWNKKKPRREMP